MDSEELDSQRRQERLRRRRQRERDARARETAEQREARLARRRERYRAQRSQDGQHTRQAQMDANRTAQRLRREAETPEARQERLQHHRAAERLRREAENSAFCACAALTVTTIYTYKFLHALTQGVLTIPPTLCYRKRSTNNVSCSLLRLAPQCPHSLVIVLYRGAIDRRSYSMRYAPVLVQPGMTAGVIKFGGPRVPIFIMMLGTLP